MTTTDKNLNTVKTVLCAAGSDIDLTAESQRTLKRIQDAEHPDCLFCGKSNPIGFKLVFRVVNPGVVCVSMPCDCLFQSYAATLHGGVISALLDAAMTNALFSLGIVAVTGELIVRFLQQVDVTNALEAIASVERNEKPLYKLTSELRQSGRIVARASAKFVDREWASSRPFMPPWASPWERSTR